MVSGSVAVPGYSFTTRFPQIQVVSGRESCDWKKRGEKPQIKYDPHWSRLTGTAERKKHLLSQIYFILHITAFVPCVRIDRAGTVTPSLRNLQRTKRQQSRRCTVHVQSSTVNAAAATPPITKDSRHCRCLFSVCRSPHLTSGYKAPPFMRLIV